MVKVRQKLDRLSRQKLPGEYFIKVFLNNTCIVLFNLSGLGRTLLKADVFKLKEDMKSEVFPEDNSEESSFQPTQCYICGKVLLIKSLQTSCAFTNPTENFYLQTLTQVLQHFPCAERVTRTCGVYWGCHLIINTALRRVPPAGK